MSLEKIDSFSQKIAATAVAFGTIALILLCVGIGTPKWESSYTNTDRGSYALVGTANFFYSCSFTNGSFNNCTSRTSNLTYYPRYSPASRWMSDYNERMQSAAGLCTVAIVFLAFALILTLIIMFIPLSTWTNLLSPILFFLACLLMIAGMAEGSRYLLFNDYSANLYQTGHVLSVLSLFLSTFAAGRIHFFRMQEEDKQLPIPIRKSPSLNVGV